MPLSDCSSPDRATSPETHECNRFLVCGLGSLGQFCVSLLADFGEPISAITLTHPQRWDIPSVPEVLDCLLIGDCRQPELLQTAGVQQCRAVLLVASEERINIETAFAVRVLNPTARLVVRSAKDNLNELVSDRLGNFVAFEATQLPALAFAIAALSSESRGFIQLDTWMLRVMKVTIAADHPWCDRRKVTELNGQTRRVLSHSPSGQVLPAGFYQWQPDAKLCAGDVIAYIELTEARSIAHALPTPALPLRRPPRQQLVWRSLPHRLSQRLKGWGNRWRLLARQPSKRVAIAVGSSVLSLLLVGTVILKLAHAHIGWEQAFYVAGVMLLGSYDTVYGALGDQDALPRWMRFMNLLYMLAGTASIAVLYALLTEALLVAKFQLPKKRPPIPPEQHVVLVGLGRVGRRMADFLQQVKQPVLGVSSTPLEPAVLPQLPVVVGDLATSLERANLATAKSVALVTDDEMANLELGLMVHRLNPDCAVVIRTFDPGFSANLDRLLPYAKVLCAYDLAAQAFVAAAFGENVLGLLRLNEQTVLATEYQIERGDGLQGKLLGQVAYGYGVVPILHQRSQQAAQLMPNDEIRLETGDRVVVLATIAGLQRVERRNPQFPTWLVRIEAALTADARFDGAAAIARISDYPLTLARDVMAALPATLPILLYQQQALRLVRELTKAQVVAQVIATLELES